MSSIMGRVSNKVKQAVEEAILRTGLVAREEIPAFIIEVPKNKVHGDLATGVAMQLARIAKWNPRQIAGAIVEHMSKEEVLIKSIEIAGPGFINFKISKAYLYDILWEINEKGSDYGRITLGSGQHVQVEFVSANPTGNLHLGHARGAAVGDALCNLLSYAGYKVTREYYVNDAGNQVNNLAKSMECRYKQMLGQDAEMPKDGYYGVDIRNFAEELLQAEGDRLLSLPDEEREEFFRNYGLQKELEKIKHDLTRFRVSFDVWFSENSLYEDDEVTKTLHLLSKNGHVYEQEGATWLRTTTFGDDKDRVLVKNDGSYTYLTPDISYHMNKFGRGFDKMINIWGADHHGYIPRVKAAMKALGNDPDKLVILITQMVSLFQGEEKVKMSKRAGKGVTVGDLMDEVGVDAIRYFFTMRSMDSHLEFDMNLAISMSNENPVYYVQYAHARICSIHRQAENEGIVLQSLNGLNLFKLSAEREFDLLRKLGELPDEVALASRDYAPHRLVRYVYELASLFHGYYGAERVITEDAEQTQARLALLGAVRTTIANVLRLVGVSAPEKM